MKTFNSVLREAYQAGFADGASFLKDILAGNDLEAVEESYQAWRDGLADLPEPYPDPVPLPAGQAVRWAITSMGDPMPPGHYLGTIADVTTREDGVMVVDVSQVVALPKREAPDAD